MSIPALASRWAMCSNWLTSMMPANRFSSLLHHLASSLYIQESMKLLIAGSVIETGRRLCQWIIERFRYKYFLSAQFDEGDPAYEWLVLFLTEENVWKSSREFIVTAKSSKRKWAVTSGPGTAIEGNAQYVPSFGAPQLFRWNGYWVEITRQKDTQMAPYGNYKAVSSLHLMIYTRDLNALSALVEEARSRYCETSKKNVTIHTVDGPTFGPGPVWNNIHTKVRRALDSLILGEGCVESLINDANEFLDMEEWYINSGIPHRRGYLLHGPPGTGKTSTVYTIAGELGLEIYSLSLASNFIDDSFLQRAVSSLPKNSLLLIEDIDCAFPSREENEETEHQNSMYRGGGMSSFMMPQGSKVTLSGLLNVIDGVNSQDGTLFFATTNHLERLDAALIRPGRVDKQIAYKLATKPQSHALFKRFFSESQIYRAAAGLQEGRRTSGELLSESCNDIVRTHDDLSVSLDALASIFSKAIPNEEFSTAEILGYLLGYKVDPEEAAYGADAWVSRERRERWDAEEREKSRKNKARGSKPAQRCPVLNGIVLSRSQKADVEEESCTSSAMIEAFDSPDTDATLKS